MAGITYAQVAAAADKLYSEKKSASIITIRKLLGTGSPNTVQKHLKTWREGIAAPVEATYNISAAMSNALTAEFKACEAKTRAEMEKKLKETEMDLEELAIAGELLETERDDLKQRVVELTTERDGIAGKSKHQDTEIALLSERLERAVEAVQKGEIEVATGTVKLTDLQQRDAAQREEILTKAKAFEAENRARTDAEQLVAVLNAKHESSQQLLLTANSRTDTLTTQLSDSVGELHIVRAQLIKQQEAAVLAATTSAKQAEHDAAMLRGRLEALQEIGKDGKALA